MVVDSRTLLVYMYHRYEIDRRKIEIADVRLFDVMVLVLHLACDIFTYLMFNIDPIPHASREERMNVFLSPRHFSICTTSKCLNVYVDTSTSFFPHHQRVNKVATMPVRFEVFSSGW